MKCIYKKELRAYFESMTGYIYLAIFMGITAYYFTVNNLLAESNDVKEYFSNMILELLFLIPILTMRLFSEEKKLKTEQLLLTVPLKVSEILMGKFWAALTVFSAGVGLTGIFVGILAIFGTVDWFTVLGCYLGVFLAGACFIAIGIFLSSLTENQTIAAIVTYAVLFGLYLVSLLGDYTVNPIMLKIIDYIALFRRYTDFTMGIFDVTAAFYYLSLTVSFLVFSGYIIAKKRKGNVIIIGLTMIILVFSNLLMEGCAERWKLRVDMTTNGLYQISDESKELMKTIEQDVEIYCICKSRDAIVEFSELLDKYELSSKRITVSYVDPYTNVIFLDELEEEGVEVGLNTIVIQSGEKRRILEMADMYQFSSDGKSLAYFNGESMLTSAILNVSREDNPKIGVIMGHGEELNEQMQSLMLQNGFDVVGVVLNQPVEDDVESLLALAPQSDFSETEIAYLDTFFSEGKSMMYFSDPSAGNLERIEGFLEEWGIRFEDDVIFDSRNNVESSPVNVVGYYNTHEITDYFQKHSYYTVVPAGRSLEDDFSNTTGCEVQVVLSTSENAYGRDINTKEFTTSQIASDTKGPFILAVTSKKMIADAEGNQKQSRVFAVGSKRIASDDMLLLSSVGNAKFLAQAMEWTVDSENAAFSISPKQVGGDPIAVGKKFAYVCGGICVVCIPIGILIPGICIWWKRRYL